MSKNILNKSQKNGMIIKYRKGGVQMKKWIVSEVDKNKVKELSRRYGLPAFTAMLLTIRGVTAQSQIERFFNPGWDMADPFSIKDMDKAVDRIRAAISAGEKICIYGDYDCDGVTSTALLYSYLNNQFADVIYYIPDRNTEGYGMNKKAVDYLKKQGVRLIVTVDNGISAIDEINYAGTLGIDVVVTDHHKPQDVLPTAVAVVNPHRLDDTSEFKDYCGAGIALQLASAMEGDSFFVLENYSDLAAFGTIADLVPLSGENRTIVKAGLIHIENDARYGIAKLIEKAQIESVNAGNVAFKLAPRINAAGRLGTPYDAVDLLLTEDEGNADAQAEKLSNLNSKRQTIENQIYEEICSRMKEQPELTYDRVLVISSEGWNSGVIGIVASKITEKYGKPCIIIAEDEDICKGSGRSIAGFSLVDAIFACSDLLEKYGGHPMAAGLSIQQRNIDAFRKAINHYADQLGAMPLMTMKLDCNLNPETIVTDMVHQLHGFEPFGYGNPKPVFGINHMHLDKIIPLSGGKHIKLAVSRGNARLNFVKFSTTPEEFPYPEGSDLDFAVGMDINLYQNREYLSFNIKDIRLSDFDTETAMREIQLYEQYRRGVLSHGIRGKFPAREEFAAVYRYLKKSTLTVHSIDVILSALSIPTLGAFKLLMILEVMKESGLIDCTQDGDFLHIQLIPVSEKVDFNSSALYRKLKEDTNYVGKN